MLDYINYYLSRNNLRFNKENIELIIYIKKLNFLFKRVKKK